MFSGSSPLPIFFRVFSSCVTYKHRPNASPDDLSALLLYAACRYGLTVGDVFFII